VPKIKKKKRGEQGGVDLFLKISPPEWGSKGPKANPLPMVIILKKNQARTRDQAKSRRLGGQGECKSTQEKKTWGMERLEKGPFSK